MSTYHLPNSLLFQFDVDASYVYDHPTVTLHFNEVLEGMVGRVSHILLEIDLRPHFLATVNPHQVKMFVNFDLSLIFWQLVGHGLVNEGDMGGVEEAFEKLCRRPKIQVVEELTAAQREALEDFYPDHIEAVALKISEAGLEAFPTLIDWCQTGEGFRSPAGIEIPYLLELYSGKEGLISGNLMKTGTTYPSLELLRGYLFDLLVQYDGGKEELRPFRRQQFVEGRLLGLQKIY